MIDTHCHLYLKEFADDIDTVIQRAVEAGVTRFYFPAIDSSTHQQMTALQKKFDCCYSMIGLHPCSVRENFHNEIDEIKEWLKRDTFVAIGEIGLDFYWDKTFVNQQYDAFHMQIEIALQHQLPIVIHSRDAMDECIEVVQQYVSRGLRGIFHCFGGSFQQAEKIIDCNFLMGIGGVITYKKSGLADVIGRIALEHLVLETDAPYLTPVPFRGKRNESAYLTYVVEKIAEAKNISRQEVINATTSNAMKLFHPVRE